MSIANFPIKAALVYPPLGPAFNEALQDIFTRQTRLNMVSSNGDLQLEGEITNYALSPQAVGEDAYATKTRLTISVSIRFTNTKDPSQDKSQSFSDYRDFDSTQMLNDVQDELVAEIVESLVEVPVIGKGLGFILRCWQTSSARRKFRRIRALCRR